MGIGGLHGIAATASFEIKDGKWTWHITPTSAGDDLKIESRDNDKVRDASDGMRSALDAFSSSMSLWPTMSDEAKDEHVEALKKAGRKLTKEMFDGREAEFVRELDAMSVKTVNIRSHFEEQLMIEFCVLKDADTEFFLGERCLCIYRMQSRERGLLDKALDIPPLTEDDLLVGYAEDDDLGSACAEHKKATRPAEEEIYVAADLAGGLDALSVLDPLTAAFTSTDKGNLIAWLRDRRHVVHFNCHATDAASGEKPRLQVRSRSRFGREELGSDRMDLTGTFVFLNACYSAVGTRSIRSSMAEYFRGQGADCIACSIGALDDRFATMFARELYRELGAKKSTIFSAFLECRGRLVKQEKHPMALMYTYLGPDQFVLPR